MGPDFFHPPSIFSSFSIGVGVGETIKNNNKCYLWDWCYWYNPEYLLQELMFLLKKLEHPKVRLCFVCLYIAQKQM